MRKFADGMLRGVLVLACAASAMALVTAAVVGLAVADFLFLFVPKKRRHGDRKPKTNAATVVIPTWNGRELLEKNLPSVLEALQGNPENEIIVVDNASTDGTFEFLRDRFPQVKVLQLPKNLGFGGGCNAGVQAARNDVVVLLNNDMRVEPDFLGPLLQGFTDEAVFSVTSQIFFQGVAKRREETGLSQGKWEAGRLKVAHRVDEAIDRPYPCFYGGGGSTAYDRKKFLELGGFDHLFRPFYLEDTDLGYMAWKRGWKVLYQPSSAVYHEHRGTIGRKFSQEAIQDVVEKNFLLWAWKNIHNWSWLVSHFCHVVWDVASSALRGRSTGRTSLRGLCQATGQLHEAMRSRLRARQLAVVDDREAFRRTLGAYFRDRFENLPEEPEQLRVLFVSPYPVLPAHHGGAVFMSQTLLQLASKTPTHLIVVLHYPEEAPPHEPLRKVCASVELIMKPRSKPTLGTSTVPHAVQEFRSEELEWLIHRQVLTQEIDVIQLEYTQLAQYAGDFQRIVCALFEHDVYFQSIARGWRYLVGILPKLKAGWEYLRALHYETTKLGSADLIQVCTKQNAECLGSFAPHLKHKIRFDLRAGIDVGAYPFAIGPRESHTMLFVGSFRHQPNQAALTWLVNQVLPRVLEAEPRARLVVAGSNCPPPHAFPSLKGIEILGEVPDIREVLARYAVFVCPVLSGSGIRVKLLEAFATGIPVVSTTMGAEGIENEEVEVCFLADNPVAFADHILRIFRDPAVASEMAMRARRYVEQNWDIRTSTARLLEAYRQAVTSKRRRLISAASSELAQSSEQSCQALRG